MIADFRATALCAWADGMLPLEAAVDLLTRTVGGRLLDGPWICKDPDGRFFWFDPGVAAAESDYLSGGERRLLAVARNLANSDHPLDLGDAITGLDQDALVLMLESLAHAGGFTAGRPGCDTVLATGAAGGLVQRQAAVAPRVSEEQMERDCDDNEWRQHNEEESP